MTPPPRPTSEAAADILTGGKGGDFLAGGSGADIFIYTASEDGGDKISDFSAGDSLAFDGTAFGGLSAGALDAQHFRMRADNKA